MHHATRGSVRATARRKAFRRRPATALGTLKGHSLRCNTGEAPEPRLCWRRLGGAADIHFRPLEPATLRGMRRKGPNSVSNPYSRNGSTYVPPRIWLR